MKYLEIQLQAIVIIVLPGERQPNRQMLSDGIRPIGDGLLDVEEERLRALLVPQDINEVYEVEQTPFAR